MTQSYQCLLITYNVISLAGSKKDPEYGRADLNKPQI